MVPVSNIVIMKALRWLAIPAMPHPVALAGAVVVRGEVCSRKYPCFMTNDTDDAEIFSHGKSFIRFIAQIKHINQKRFLLCLLICVFKFPT